MQEKRTIHAADITKIALFVALLSAASYLVIPLPATPIVVSLHTAIVVLAGLVLPLRHGVYTMLTYLLMGFLGLPVLAGGTGGAGKLFGPTGGFYFGFLAATFVICLLRGRTPCLWRWILVSVCVGLPIWHGFGILFACLWGEFTLGGAFLAFSLPFLAGDIFKCVLAAVVAHSLVQYAKI